MRNIGLVANSGLTEDGFYAEEERQPEDGPTMKQKVVKKIPEKVIQNAKGLAIFTTMRTGLWMSGAGGSGILVGRLPDGSWSPPSGILLHTAGLGFLVGVDIYDCVVVINTEAALEAFTKIRCTLGSEISVAAGPVGAGGILETELHKRQAPIFTYMKSRGFYAGVQIDGTIIIERTDENERFYGERIPVKDILAGKIRHPPYEIRRLMETIKAAQGNITFDASAIPTEPPPGDYVLEDGHVFGIPEKDDPDPYGVMALEKEGLSLKEAGTHKRASWEEFSFNPAPTSPVHAVYARNGVDRTVSRRNSWRTSTFTNEPKTPSSLRTSMEQRPISVMTDSATQTDFLPDPPSPSGRSVRSMVSRRSSRRSTVNGERSPMQEVPENEVLDTSPTRKEPESASGLNGYSTPPHTPPLHVHNEDTPDQPDEHGHDDEHEDLDDAHIEEPVVHSIQKVQPASPTVISKARLVTVPKRVPPVLPPRNPNRSGPLVIDASPKVADSGEQTVSPVDPRPEEPAPERPVDVDEATEKMDNVKLEDEEEAMPNPWAKVEERRQRESMPGGFD